MKKLMIVTALMTALMGTSAAFAEDSKGNDSKSISFEEAEKMEQMSEQDKKQKGGNLLTWAGGKIYQGYQLYDKSKYVKPVIETVGTATTVYDAGAYVAGKIPQGSSYTGGSPAPLTGQGSTMPTSSYRR